jgi:hypothetical protein
MNVVDVYLQKIELAEARHFTSKVRKDEKPLDFIVFKITTDSQLQINFFLDTEDYETFRSTLIKALKPTPEVNVISD